MQLSLQINGSSYKTCAEGYRFGFNGQEKDDEILGAGNTMTAEFWEYDARLGRRWNRDPKAFVNISDYACFVNSPIIFNDVNGDIIGGDKQKANDVKDAAKTNIERIDGDIKSLCEKIDNRSVNGKNPTKRQINELENLISQKSAFKNVIREINELENDLKQVYNIIQISGNEGKTEYNEKTKALDVYVTGTIQNSAHELKHAHQFLKGEISFKTGGASGYITDIGDEVSAYQRGYLFGQKIFGSGSEITPNNVRNLNKSYLGLASESLTLNSTLQKVYEANNLKLPPIKVGNPIEPYIEFMKKNKYDDEVFHPKF